MLYRFALNLYKNKIERDAFNNQVFRETSALRASAEVWSDVASSQGLGFRYGDSGPLLHGDLASGAALEIGVYEGKVDGAYRTAARARAAEASVVPGSVVVRPHTGLTRALGRVWAVPPNIPAEIAARYFVRADPPERAAQVLGPDMQAALVEQADRGAELYAEHGEVTLVLEGIELQHERLERIVTALAEATKPPPASPYR